MPPVSSALGKATALQWQCCHSDCDAGLPWFEVGGLKHLSAALYQIGSAQKVNQLNCYYCYRKTDSVPTEGEWRGTHVH